MKLVEVQAERDQALARVDRYKVSIATIENVLFAVTKL